MSKLSVKEMAEEVIKEATKVMASARNYDYRERQICLAQCHTSRKNSTWNLHKLEII
tara:strand:+ start:331 stop:501 length:171 start_codon:yes stop_codon:yes gene_type:complete